MQILTVCILPLLHLHCVPALAYSRLLCHRAPVRRSSQGSSGVVLPPTTTHTVVVGCRWETEQTHARARSYQNRWSGIPRNNYCECFLITQVSVASVSRERLDANLLSSISRRRPASKASYPMGVAPPCSSSKLPAVLPWSSPTPPATLPPCHRCHRCHHLTTATPLVGGTPHTPPRRPCV